MARIGSMLGVSVLLFVSGVVHAVPLSPTADFIKTRPYMQLSTDDPIGTILLGDIDKASGIVPSVGRGLVVWADGRSGRVAIMGFDLTDPGRGEFLISDETDDWQEGNPFAGYNDVGGYRWSVYDAAEVTTGGGDIGDIQGSNITPAPTWLFEGARRQRSPVFTNLASAGVTILSWIDYPGTVSDFVGHENTDIYLAMVNEPIVTPLPGLQNVTLGKPAPRDSLAADGRYLTWQELRYDDVTEVTHWDVVVYDLGGTYANNGLRFRTIDAPVAGRNQIAPDISGDLVVFTQVEDPNGLIHPTNIYFQDLSDPASVPVAITTSDTATNAAISNKDGNYFVVWQDYRLDGSTTVFPGGNGEPDFNWDIWGQEISKDGNGDWALHAGGPFLIRADAGRQSNPDIDGVDVSWQSQGPGTEDIYVWGPIPEPATAIVIAIATPLLVAARRRRRKQEK